MDKRRIILIRHLPTSMNKNGKYMGRKYDLEIKPTTSENESFRLKIVSLKKLLNLNSVELYSSPTKRCIQTLELVRKELGLKSKVIIEDNSFWETNMGDLEGMDISEIKKRYPSLYETRV